MVMASRLVLFLSDPSPGDFIKQFSAAIFRRARAEIMTIRFYTF